jgi:hypothetical protein
VQPKLNVGDVNDPLEHEAEAMAEHVARGEPAATVSRMAAPEKKDEPVRRATAPEKKKDESVRRAATPEKKKDEPVRRAATPEKKDELVRRAAAPEKKKDEPVRRAAAPDKRDEAVQRAAQGSGSSDAMSSAAQHAVDTKGAGKPLDSGVRSRIESSTGADLGHVRVHDDHAAQSAAGNLSARAFTHGSDIWMGPGESSGDVHLMAHEAAHVLQQSGDSAQRLVQRTNGAGGGGPPAGGAGGTAPAAADAPAAPPPDPATLPLATGRPDPAANTITFAELQIPPFKMAAHRGSLYGQHKPLKRKNAYDRGNPRQRDRWRDNVTTARIQSTLEDRIRRSTNAESVDASATHVLQVPTRGEGAEPFLFGPLPTLARALTTPMWGRSTRNPALNFYDVDHIVELQIANWGAETWGNDLDNMELLDSEINQESGRVIQRNIESKVEAFLAATGTTYGTSVADVKERYTLIFNEPVAGGGGARSAGREQYWTRAEIENAEHLSPVRVSSAASLGGEGRLAVFSTEAGGLPKSFRWPGENVLARERDWLKPFVITRKNFITEGDDVENSASLGTLWINVPANDENWQPWPEDKSIEVQRLAGARYAGYVVKASVLSHMYGLRHKRLSPIRVDTFELLPDGLFLQGVVLPDVPILRDAQINFELSRGRLMLYKEFTAGGIHVPPPFVISSTSLRVFADTERGLGADGRVNFEIQRLGQGYVAAQISTSGPIGFSGAFDFDTSTFDPARIELSYLDNVFRGRGIIGIPDGKVPGVKRAQVEINVEGTAVSGTGTIEPTIQAIREGTVTFAHSEAGGTSIGGTLQLSDEIPNVQGGSVEATLSKPAGQETWDLAARGTVTAGVPGFTATVNAEYRNGLFTVEGAGAFQRGMLSGTVTVGATNRAIGADGTPTDTIGDQVIAYGGGTVTVQLTPWLQGSVGVRFLPNGELELTGSIALPSVLEVFPEKRFDRNIFSINIDIPIIGFSVAGQRIGIFATIGGGLDLSAGIGPGQLQELGISITYNPDHEDQTHIQGGAKLVIPADAGLRLFIRGALGAGIPIVSAELGLELGGRLGLEGAVEASVNVDWTPSTGLVLDALGEIYVQPKFRFDLTGYLEVVADLFFTEIDLYEKRWELAAFEVGPDLRFGVRFPIHYEEGQPFDISLDDLQFEVPDVDTRALLGDIIDRIL